jgi:glycosyltransferase involved in cell wall biosynthesis
MYQGRKVAAVVPAYNVANEIANVIAGIPELVDKIFVVDDTSTDNTAAVLSEIKDLRLTVVRHQTNQGVGGATVTGFRRALDWGAALIAKIDGDDQMDPHFLPALLDPIVNDGYQYAKGNRFLDAAGFPQMPPVRLVGAFVLTFLSKLATGYWHVFDPVNGYVVAESGILRRIPLDHLQRRYFFETDMLIHLNILTARVKDVPIPPRYGNERSSMSVAKVMVTFPVFLVRGFCYRMYQRHVLREFSIVPVFWLFGLLLFGWGAGFGAYEWIRSILTERLTSTGTVMLSVLPLVLGFQLLLQAILIEIQDSPR